MELKPESLFTNPAVTPFVECPGCQRLIGCETKMCPHCREEIDPEYARASRAVIIYNTAACGSANTIKTAEYGALIVFVATLIGIWAVTPALAIVNLLTPVISVAAIVVWFRRFGWIKFGDAEFEKAKRDMRISLGLWMVLLVVQVLAIVYFVKVQPSVWG